jgi:hypothetical protein
MGLALGQIGSFPVKQQIGKEEAAGNENNQH